MDLQANVESYHSARKSVIAQFESRYVRWLVRRTRGNISEAARVAGIERATVYRLLHRHRVTTPIRQPDLVHALRRIIVAMALLIDR